MRDISISSSGEYQVAVTRYITPPPYTDGGQIYISSNYGVNWRVANGPDNKWLTVSISDTGQHQIASFENNTGYGGICISNDYGVTWATRGPGFAIKSVSISSTGQYQSTLYTGSNIFTSDDYGVTWIARDSTRSWGSISISSTGQFQMACTGSEIYKSIDYGVNWTLVPFSTFGKSIIKVSVSSTGQYHAAPLYGHLIYIGVGSIGVTYFRFNLDNGTTFFITGTSPTANYSANFTITVLDTTRCYYITLINKTSSVASYYCNSVSINGTSRTLLYTGSRVLTGAAQTNQEFIVFYNTTTSAWVVLTNIKVFKA
jgi:hypothetical protein